MTTIINATPHDIHLHRPDGTVLDITPSGLCPRVTQVDEPVAGYEALPVPVVRSRFGEPDPLPPVRAGVYYVVSQLYAAAARRPDLLIPSGLVRDESGRIVGCRALAVVP